MGVRGPGILSGSLIICPVQRGYSHGCHRLQNDRAVRLYGFLLAHRTHEVKGEMEIPFRRTYLYKDEAYEMYLPSQGFRYLLDPPIPVEVLKGTIAGEVEEPIEDMMEIPGKEYPVPIDFLDQKDAGVADDDTADAAVPTKQKPTLIRQRHLDPWMQHLLDERYCQTVPSKIPLCNGSVRHCNRAPTGR